MATVRDLDEETGLLQPVLTVYMIFTVPGLTAVTSPEDASTVAINTLLVLHTPPGFPVVVYVEELPGQSGDVPLTVPALAFGLTVTVAEAGTALRPVKV